MYYNICVTVEHESSNEIYTTYISLASEDEARKFKLHNLNKRSCGMVISTIEIDKFPFDVEPMELVDFQEWLDGLVFHKTVLCLVASYTRIIKLPEWLKLSGERLTIQSGLSFGQMENADCLEEAERAQWVLKEFPHSKFASSRITFDLASPSVKYHEDGTNSLALYRYVYNGEAQEIVEFKCIYGNMVVPV